MQQQLEKKTHYSSELRLIILVIRSSLTTCFGRNGSPSRKIWYKKY